MRPQEPRNRLTVERRCETRKRFCKILASARSRCLGVLKKKEKGMQLLERNRFYFTTHFRCQTRERNIRNRSIFNKKRVCQPDRLASQHNNGQSLLSTPQSIERLLIWCDTHRYRSEQSINSKLANNLSGGMEEASRYYNCIYGNIGIRENRRAT